MLDRRTTTVAADFGVEPEFDFLSAEYRELYERSSATAFQAPLWLHMIYRQLMPELSAQSHVVTLRDCHDGRLRLVLPLALITRLGVTLLQPADFGLCDYNAVVAENDTLEALADDPHLLHQLQLCLAEADLFLFRKVRTDGFDISRLFGQVALSPGENAAYHVEIGDDFQQWQNSTLSKSFSKNLRRLQRQLETQLGSYEHRQVTNPAEIRAAFAFLRRARAGQFDNDLLADPVYFDFYVDYAVAAIAASEACLFVSYVNGNPAAFLFGLTGDGAFHAVQIGVDTANFEKFSVGSQILYQAIKTRFHEGHRSFDMGLGNTGYKTHFRVTETGLYNFSRPLSLRGRGISAVYHHAKPLKNILRRLIPRLH